MYIYILHIYTYIIIYTQKDSEQIAEEIDEAIHSLQYKLGI
jgi:hypothetical protein